MDLSWELEQLGRSADPEVVLEGSRLLHRVSDILRRDDGSMHALVRGEAPQVVTVPSQHSYEAPTCTCGEVRQLRNCAHAIAVSLREMQIYHGLEDSQVARWERYVGARRELSDAWGGLAISWLESFTCGDEGSAAAVFHDAESLDAHMQIARGLVGKASGEQLSAFLVKLAKYHGMDGTSPLGRDGVLAADGLMNGLWQPLDASHPEASTEMILSLIGSVRRTVTVPSADWRLSNTLALAASSLRPLLADGHADPVIVADTLLAAELAAPASHFPWIALVFERLDREAKPVARAMRDLLDQREFHPDLTVTDSHSYRMHAEIRLSSEGVPGLLPVLEEWPDAPYGEFLCRLPASWVPMPRVQLLESAHRMGRLRWAPGWPQHDPRQFARWPVRHIHESLPGHPMWGDVAIGDVVVAIAGLGRTDEARRLLHDHALRDSESSHSSEFSRVWTTANLGDGMEEAAEEIFGPTVSDLDCLLAELSRIPELSFCCELSAERCALGTILLTAVLLEDIPPEGHARNLQAPTWATSFFSYHPAATDNLRVLAALPADEVAGDLEGGVLDRELAQRIQRIASQVIAGGCTDWSLADVRGEKLDLFLEALENAADSTPLTVALVALLLGRETHSGVEVLLRRYVHRARGAEPANPLELLELAYAAEPRGADLTTFLVALALVEHEVERNEDQQRR